MAAPTDTLCMGCASAACDFKPLRLQRRPLGEHDVLIDMKFCGICHSDGARCRARRARRARPRGARGPTAATRRVAVCRTQAASARADALCLRFGCAPPAPARADAPRRAFRPGSAVHIACGAIEAVAGKVVYPIVPGHELAGVCTAVGPGVTKFKVGDHVGVGCMVDACLECASCRAGEEQKCSKGNIATYNGNDKFGRAQTYPPGGATLGGYTTRMVVHERFGILVPQGYPLEFAGPVSACPPLDVALRLLS